MLRTIKRWAFAVFTSVVVAAVIGVLVVPAAYMERGYWAIGGEWLLVLVAFVLTMWGLLGNE